MVVATVRVAVMRLAMRALHSDPRRAEMLVFATAAMRIIDAMKRVLVVISASRFLHAQPESRLALTLKMPRQSGGFWARLSNIFDFSDNDPRQI